MTQPHIADKKPEVLDLQPGKYFWCQCGLSKTKSFCDGSHKGTEFTPLAFEVETAKKVAICNCKQAGTPPFCDGAHTKL